MSDVQSRLAAALAGRYRIERELGAGGMATVFLAHDERHGRDVAIKVLHEDLGAALGGERFLSEIKTTAKLQHPHILPLLDSGSADGLLFYVMPHVKGETLRTRLERETQLPVADALAIAREVADALAEAHAQGIVHRDIKPENVLLQGGHAIVADFGIALAVQQAGGARMTQTGLSLGTPQYMAPEQAMGERNVDHRVDQYALAAMTYEMLTGEPPHTGPSAQAIVAKILSEPVRPSTVLRPAVPAHVEAALQVALAKLPADRFAGVREFAEALRGGTGARATSSTGARGAGNATGSATRTRAWVVVGATALAFAAAGGWLLGRRTPAGATVQSGELSTRFLLEFPAGVRVPVVVNKTFALAPDGSAIVFTGSANGRASELFLRRFDATDAQRIAGTTGATEPTFSPNGQWIGCVIAGQVAKVPVGGGTPTFLAPIPGGAPRGLTWTRAGELIYGTSSDTTLYAVSENGGSAHAVFRAPRPQGLRWPITLAGTDDIMYEVWSRNGVDVQVWAGSPATGQANPIGGDTYSPLGLLGDDLLYVTRPGDLMAVHYDRAARKVSGVPVRVLANVLTSITTAFAYAALGPGGDLVFLEGSGAGQLVAMPPGGAARPLVNDTANFEDPRISPDARSIAVTVVSGSRKAVWLLDRASAILSRFTEEDAAPVAVRDRPEWFADGRRVLYRNAGNGAGYATRPLDRSEPERPLPTPAVTVNELVVHPDGKTVMGRVTKPPMIDLAWWTLGDTTVHAYTHDPELETGPRFSPDGKWLAYSVSSSGQREVFVSPFPGPAAPVQISRGGGGLPVWSRDGRTLFYPKGNALMAASLSFDGGIRVAGERLVFESPGLDNQLHAPYDVGPGGEVVFVRPVRDARAVVIRNLGAEVAKLRSRASTP
ncbi:MAG: serine/threonine-protein kinase [Gemmatimonadetes bacterium]|nr:serine/threonine-protein kinase [Gemmatimonadota bacterium]